VGAGDGGDLSQGAGCAGQPHAAPGAPLCRRLLAAAATAGAVDRADDGRWLAGTGLVRGAVIRMTGRIA
jgi:hypothetical protein